MAIERVLISGAGIAGPALAWWLVRRGIRVTVVERAPELRRGGQAVDFRGPAHLDVLRRMDLLDAIRAQQTQMGSVSFLDREGRRAAELPSSFLSGEVEIARGDLSRLLYDRTRDRAEYRFGEGVTALTERADGVEVHFLRAPPETFDLVVGADGLHSAVRALALGPEEQFLRFHDHYVAGLELPNLLGLDREGVIYSDVGRGVSYSSLGVREPARALFVFRSPRLASPPRDLAAQKELVGGQFTSLGWEVRRLVVALGEARDLYFDSISSVNLPSYARGRVVLLGDAAYGGTMGGQGTGLAMVGAYVLAGELARSDTFELAFRRYEECLRPYARGCQSGLKHVGPFYAPPTRLHRWMRDHLYRVLATRPLKRVLESLTTQAARGIQLERYAL